MPSQIIATGALNGRIAVARSRMALPQRHLGAAITDLVRAAAKSLFDPYRPELHYMRGPGPKWRERHGDRRPRD